VPATSIRPWLSYRHSVKGSLFFFFFFFETNQAVTFQPGAEEMYLNSQTKIKGTMLEPLPEGLEPFPRYEAEPMDIEIDLKVVWTLHYR
jgi:hypothetical protein